MKIYTKTGDDGTTGLFGGERRSKDAPRIEAYGEVDELNSLVGVVRSSDLPDDVSRLLEQIQSDLFVLGADLATPERKERKNITIPRVTGDHVACLESAIDEFDEKIPDLTSFILPGGGMAGAHLHLARTVCRRAERRLVSLVRSEPDVGETGLIYLNRLADLLFVLARYCNMIAEEPETAWNPNEN